MNEIAISRRSTAATGAGRGVEAVIVGGGAFGLLAALVAAERGLRVTLLERDALCGATSGAWFRILHGGLRYLQTLDVARLRRSMLERRWFLQRFPDVTSPHDFLMPLYDLGLKRPDAFRAAFALEALLTVDRNRGVRPDRHVPHGSVIGADAVAGRYPDVRRDGLTGGALWVDAIAPDQAALVSAMAAAARAAGATILEGVEATGLVVEGGRTAGVVARERASGRELRFPAQVAINAAGPWSGVVADRLDRSPPGLFEPALGFNVVLDRPPLTADGVSVSPPGRSGPMLFMFPERGRTFAGTWYTPWTEGPEAPIRPSEAAIEAFLDALAAAAPALGARRRDVVAILPGLLPARRPGTIDLANRDVVHAHAASGGPAGLCSLSGVKFTTARHTALRALELALADIGATRAA